MKDRRQYFKGYNTGRKKDRTTKYYAVMGMLTGAVLVAIALLMGYFVGV